MSRSDSDNKKERKTAIFDDGSGVQQRSTQWLPPLSMLTEKDDATCWFARLEAFFKVGRISDCEKSNVVLMYLNERIMTEAASRGLTPETDYSVLKDSLLNQLRVDINHSQRRMELSRFPTAGEVVEMQMAKDQLLRGLSDERVFRQEEMVLDRMRSAISEATVGHGEYFVSHRQTIRWRRQNVDCRQDIERLTANPPSQRLAVAVCLNCSRSCHHRWSCPLSKARRERRLLSTTGEQREYEVGCNAIREGKCRSLKLLVDTGAEISLILEAELKMASNVRISKYGSTAEVDINIGDKLLTRHSMIVARSLSYPCLLCIDFLRRKKALIDLDDDKIEFSEVWLKLESSQTHKYQNRGETQQKCHICLLQTVTLPAQTEMIVTRRSDSSWIDREGFFEPTPKLVNNHLVMAACSLSRAAGGTVPTLSWKLTRQHPPPPVREAKKNPQETGPMNKYSELIDGMLQLPRNIPNVIRKQLRAMFWKYKRVIATDDYDTGRTNICKHSINTEPLCGPWSSPIVLVKKKDGSYRFCVGYRKLNYYTKKDAQPLPKIEETLETLSVATWFSTLDLPSGYWQVEVADEDKEKTASTNPFWLYQFQGKCTLRVTLSCICMVYVDDIILFRKDASEPLENFDEVFSRLQGAGLKIKPTKCQLFQEKVKYLGHVVARDGVQPVPEKIKAVEQWPILICAKELQQFLCLASYYRRLVKGFPQLAEPLLRLQNTFTPCAAVSSMMGKCQKCEYSLIWPAWTAAQLETAQEKGLDIAEIRKTLQSLLSKKDQMIVKDGVLFRRRLTAHADYRAGYQFVKCQECSRRKSGSKRHRGQLQPQILPYPMSRISVNFIEPFQWAERRNRYILTVQD
ncbi:Retrovirus-related Pol polyprotein from transposon 17.6 [Trichinella papuae]|uniref:Retrovirus-related Pol polyprotein from transposon 17.6 n=1 Tax=Trichinella papuae TaxID=268474 RepID=A0A0V1MID2_9BILA|nr:Retrovirus-related Pol polyprotein from transposon 17.6 [Trichinella papuae]